MWHAESGLATSAGSSRNSATMAVSCSPLEVSASVEVCSENRGGDNVTIVLFEATEDTHHIAADERAFEVGK